MWLCSSDGHHGVRPGLNRRDLHSLSINHRASDIDIKRAMLPWPCMSTCFKQVALCDRRISISWRPDSSNATLHALICRTHNEGNCVTGNLRGRSCEYRISGQLSSVQSWIWVIGMAIELQVINCSREQSSTLGPTKRKRAMNPSCSRCDLQLRCRHASSGSRKDPRHVQPAAELAH